MTNEIKMDLNDKNFKNVVEAIEKDISASRSKLDSFDEMYQTVCKYVNITKEQFKECYKQAEEKLKAYNENRELCEEELDMVVGGSGSIGDKIKTIALIVGTVIAVTAAASGVGAGIGAGWMAIFGNVTVAEGAAWGAAILGSVTLFGGTVGGIITGMAAFQNDNYKFF